MKDKTKGKKIKAIVWPVIYAILVLGICCSSCFLFHSYYYRSIFVSGPSMQPTLKGGRDEDKLSDFGIIDPTSRALRRIERFDIVTTFFPWADYEEDGTAKETAEYKIKRVIALPGESIKIDNKSGDLDFEFHIKTKQRVDGILTDVTLHYGSNPEKIFEEDNTNYIKIPFSRTLYHPDKMMLKNTHVSDPEADGWYKLEDDEYWVMGDNLTESTDSAYVEQGKNHGPVKFSNLVGVLVAIEGTCKIVPSHYVNGKLIPATCINRKYKIPKVF